MLTADRYLRGAAGLLFCSLLAGCAHVWLPAIDPSGEGLFAGTTTLESHHGLFHRHRDPQPAAVVPVLPTQPQPLVAVPLAPAAPSVPVTSVACGPQQMVVPGLAKAGGPVCANPAAYRGPELLVTPARIVAPVNSEVILAAGISAPGGYYVMRQPLEWMLAQDGVGQIVAVGHESPYGASFVLRNSPQKVATNYARAHTSTISQTLDRGTPSPADDVFLHKGQSWITVTSPTEGTSHVVVWAPKEHNWERRKTTATIFWIDAAWQFPPCAVVRAGGGRGQTLTTVVTRSDGLPLAGWRVRYEVLEGPPAVFSARRNTALEVITDAAGRATAQLLPASQEPGITTIGVQIVRPVSGRGDLPQMIVGQGTTSVQWTTPGLSVRATGTSSALADGAISYRVEVTNGGDLVTRNVTLSFEPPPGVTLLNSSPAAQAFGQTYRWQIGDLPPGTTSVVELNCQVTVTASIRSVFRATSSDAPAAEGRVVTEVFANAISVKMTGPETAAVGTEAKFLIDVTNIGRTTLTNLVASDTFEAGLVERGGAQSPAVRALVPALEPGQTHSFALTFVVAQAGRWSHRLDVSADGGHRGSARSFIIGTQPVLTPPQLSLKLSGPPSRRVGEVAEYTLEVQNTGAAPATNVVLALNWAPSLDFDRATNSREDQIERRTTLWRIPEVRGGQSVTKVLRCLCREADERAEVRASVTSQQTAAVSQVATTRIVPGLSATPPPRPFPAPQPAPAAAGSLKVAASLLANPIKQGDAAICVITVTNDRTVTDQDVAISVQLVGDGLRLTRAPVKASATPAVRVGADSIEFAPIREMRAGEALNQTAPYRIEVEGARPGRHKIRVTVTSSRSPQGVVAEAELTVSAP